MNQYSIEDVTVVVIGRNEGANLPRCFESIQHVTKNIVFVDSRSTDNSLDVAREFGVPVVITLESNFYSASLGRVVGAKHVKTPLIQFLDGDMKLDGNWIAGAVQFLNEKPKAAVVHGFKHEYKKNDRDYVVKADERDWRSDYLQGAYLIKREAYEEADGLDPRFPGEEERDLYVRLHAHGHEVWYKHQLMSSHYDFKDRGWRYLFFSDVAGVITVPLIKSLAAGNILPYIYVYRRLLPVLLADFVSLLFLLTFSWTGVVLALAAQLVAFVYARAIKRPGYFIIWKSALLNFRRTVRIMRRKVQYHEHVESSAQDASVR
jgi:glycosyltransferase involved in cell wall biosynthesis